MTESYLPVPHAGEFGLPEDIRRCKESGHFTEALRLIALQLNEPGLPDALKESLLYQKRICQRLPQEFPYTISEALGKIRERIPDFSEAELLTLLDQRKIRWIYVEGEKRLFERFFDSLCKTIPSFAQRAGAALPGLESAHNGSQTAALLDQTVQLLKATGTMANRIRIRATIRLKDELFTPGMFLRAHLPIPLPTDRQSDIVLEQISPEGGIPGGEDALQRTICWEGYWQENPTFTVEYSYTHTAVYRDVYASSGLPGKYDFDVAQQPPHIVFTPYIRALCRDLTVGLTDPLAKVRAFYDYITQNMGYTYMPSYDLLENIAENCALNHTGDCGVFALLLITLCRCAGIPAQWESGLTAEPNFIGGHDWVRFYVAPFGWLYADPSYGVAAVRSGNEERRQFYFGNLDPFRFVANRAFQAPLSPPKSHHRADPYDNQLGELESDSTGYDFGDTIRTKQILSCQQI